MPAELTILNGMADSDFDAALARHRQWGLKWLDLRDCLYGDTVGDLDAGKARRVRDAVDAAGLEVYCLSTTLLHDDLDKGEAHFRAAHLARIADMAAAVRILRPRFLRLLAARLDPAKAGGSAFATLERDYPWVVPLYREAVERAAGLGAAVTIENEARDCMLRTPADMVAFFAALDRPDLVGLTWDIQNQWTCGSFPAVEDYETLRPLIQYVHVKGGQYADPHSRALAWKSGLEEASWPVLDIVRRVVEDGVSPVICLNPSKGRLKPEYGYDYGAVTERDIAFLRRNIEGIV